MKFKLSRASAFKSLRKKKKHLELTKEPKIYTKLREHNLWTDI